MSADLSQHRFCPRCSEFTIWRPGLNGVDDGVLYCSNIRDDEFEPCGLTLATVLTDAEHQAFASYMRGNGERSLSRTTDVTPGRANYSWV